MIRIKAAARPTLDTPTVRRSPGNALTTEALARPMPPSRRALTTTPGDDRANSGSESVPAAELGADKVAVVAKSLAQREDLNLQVLLRNKNAWPHTAEKLVFGDQRSVSLQQDQEEIKGARPQLYRHAVGDQFPAAQQHAETAEFERRVGGCRARPICAMRRRVLTVEGGLRVAIRRHRGPPFGSWPAIW